MNDKIKDVENKDKNKDYNQIINLLLSLHSKVDSLGSELQTIKVRLNSLQGNCSRMDNHIDFVETVYESVRHPLEFIRKRISGSNTPLPIKESDDNSCNVVSTLNTF
jgi:archaellum component FlaC